MKKEHHITKGHSFKDRNEAGIRLGEKLYTLKNNPSTCIIAIPNGGVPVAAGISRVLGLPFSLFPCQQMKHPAYPDQTIGSVCQDEVILHPEREIPTDLIHHEVIRIKRKMHEKAKTFGIDAQQLEGKTIILADDRLKNEDTLLAGLTSLLRRNPKKVIVAVPVISYTEMKNLKEKGIEVVSLLSLATLDKTETYFEHFEPVTEDQIHQLLHQSTTFSEHN